jgi:hypothetical protein
MQSSLNNVNLIDNTFGMKNRKKSKKVQQYAENLANAKIASQNGGRLLRGQASTVAGREAEERKARKAKLAREKKERELVKLLGAGYALKNATSKKIQKQVKAQQKKLEMESKAAQLAQDKIDFAIPIVGLDQVMMCDGRSEVSRLLCRLYKREARVRNGVDGQTLLDIQLVDGSTKYPVNMVIRGELAKSFGDEGFKINKVVDIRDCVAIMRAVRGQPRRIQVEMVEATEKRPATSIVIASERLSKHCQMLVTERDEIRARGGIPIEEMIEEERMALPAGGTPVTEKTFFKWLEDRKKRRLKEKKEAKEESSKRKRGKFLSGKALFAKSAELFVDDEAGAGADVMSQRVTLSDAEDDSDDDQSGYMYGGGDDDDDAGSGETKQNRPAPPVAPSTGGASGTIHVGGQAVKVGDASVFLDGDDDDLDLDDLDD